MSEANLTPATEDPPPLITEESAASDKKNNAEEFGPEERRDVAVTSKDADEVKNGCENGTEGTVDEDANIVEADDANGGDSDSGLHPTGMSEENPTPATEDPPPLLTGESTASDKKNNAEKFGPEESRDVAVTSNNADEVKNGCENGTEGTADEDANIVEADDANGSDSDRGLHPTGMSEANPAPATEDPPLLVTGESAASDKNNAEKFVPEESGDVVVTSNNADEVKNDCEHGTEGTADEDANIVEADDANGGDSDRGLRPTGMSEANPTPAIGDSPSLVNGESAASDKNNAEKFVPEASREVAVTSNSAGEVRNGYENGTEGASDEYTNVVEADDANGGDSYYPNVVGAEDVKMVYTQHETNIEAVDVKMVDTQHEANIEAEDVKMIDTQHKANIEAMDVKTVGTQDARMVHTHHEANIEAEEDACLDKEGKNWDNQHAMATEGEDIKMVEAKADARNSEAQDVKEDACQKKNHTNIEDKDMRMADREDACQKEGKEGKNEDCQYAKVSEAHEMKILEADKNVRSAELQGNGKKEEMEDQVEVEENENNVNIEDDDAKTVDKEVTCQKEGDRNNENSHDAKIAESDEINIVVAKTNAGNAEVEKKGKEEKSEKTEEEKNNANIETDELIVLEKDSACQKVDKKVKNEDIQDAKESDAEDMDIVEGKTDATISEAIENRNKEEMDSNAEENKNDVNIDTESVIMVDKENACQHKHEGKTDDSQDAKAAEGEDIKIAEAKSDAGNAEVDEIEKEEKEEQNEEKAHDVNNQTDEVKSTDKEDACQKEDKERKNEDSHGTKAAEKEEIMVVEAKSAAGHAEVKENRKRGEDEDKTEEKQNDNKERTICLEKQDEDKMEPADVDKQEKQDGSKEEEKGDVDKHELSDREESIKESHAVLKGDAKGNVGKQEMDDRDQNVKEKQEGLEEEERVGSSKPKTAKDEQDGTAEKQEGEKQDVNVAAEKKEEEKQDAELTAEENDKTQEGKVAAEKKEYEKVKENVSFEKNAEMVIEMEVSEKNPVEIDKQERQDGLKEEEKGGIDEHELSDREESIKESQEVLKGEAKGNVGQLEMDDREKNVKEKREGSEEEGVGSSNSKAAKDEQDEAAEKQEGDIQDVNVAAEKKEEEKQVTAEEKNKTQDGKVAAEKKEDDGVNENVIFEKNAETVIEMGDSEKGEEMEMNEKTSANKQEEEKDNHIDDISKQSKQKKGTKRSNTDMEEAGNGTEAVAKVGESGNNLAENKDEAPKSKKARVVREEGHKKDKKQGSSKSRDTKDSLSNPSPYSLDRPTRERKTVERLVEVIEKEPGGSLFVEKGRGTPLKNIPGVSYRISRKTNHDLKFLHQILFGRFGRAADFKTHILEFSGFVWHESDEKHRAKAKEKLDNCSKDTLCDLCDLLTVPVSRVNIKKEDIVTKLLDFIAEPHANDDSTLSDDQGSNSRKRRREGGNATKSSEGTHKRSRKNLDDEHTSRKRQQKYFEFESDEEAAEEGHEEDEHIKSDRKENKDDSEEADDEQEDSYASKKVKASKKSMEGKGYTAKRRAITGSVPKTAPAATLSKCSIRVSSSSKSSKDKQSSAEDSNSRKSKPITPKRAANAQKETDERRSSGKGLTRSKGKSAGAEKTLPSKAELQNTIVGMLKKVDMNTTTYSDILKMLDKHYKVDLSSRKEDIKLMVYDELVKKAAESDDED
ncbi:unnamed protein product [Urochloa decumbens]|uniref:DEK-C domain-containing protein n=1 Tax=Urochloa decumbens TaxID=240449 RepID=A0ABC8YEN1_9POAL